MVDQEQSFMILYLKYLLQLDYDMFWMSSTKLQQMDQAFQLILFFISHFLATAKYL
jgi:hypothetical protein